MSIVGVNYGLATVGKLLLELAQTLYSKKKFGQPFSKVVGVGKAHKYFSLMKSFDSQTACCLVV